MTKTTNYNLNQWDAADPIRREDFNADNAAIDAALAAARTTGDRGLGVLKKLAGDVCRLAYQQDGKGTYTGWREGIAFDGLNADHQVESTAGAAVLEPANGRIRLAVDGWTGGSVSWSASTFTVPASSTGGLLSEEWTPGGCGTLTTVKLTASLTTAGGTWAEVHVDLMCGEETRASTDTISITSTSGASTFTFPTAVALGPHEKYRLKLAVYNPIANGTATVKLTGSTTMTVTAVRCTEGGFTAEPFPLEGREITAWVQAGEDVDVTAELELPEGWAGMPLEQTRTSQTPEGTACQEWIFSLTSPRTLSAARLRFSVESETECMVYGYGAIAV